MNLAVLAAWLHDIGKFAQRSGAVEPETNNGSRPPGAPAQPDAFYTRYFINHILPLPDELKSSRGALADLAAPAARDEGKSRECMAIKEAARLALGGEESADGDFGGARMDAIFSKVRLNGKGLDKKTPAPKYKLLPLNDDAAIFPTESAKNGPDYRTLWKEFLAALQNIPLNLGAKAWQATLVSLLERYCWCIPITHGPSLSDVSLFDHSAITAAITQAMLGGQPDGENFILFGGDLSGIQAFIFGQEEPADKGAARLLRARSFLLQAVTRSIWLSLLERLNLAHAAKIMDSGGRFALLLPGGEGIRAQLENFEYEVEKWLFENFQGAIRINFAALEFSKTGLEKENFAASFKKFGELLEDAKLHPFRRVFAAGASPVFSGDFSEFGECIFCRTRPAVKNEDEQGVCGQCAQLKKLGKALPKARFIVFASGKSAENHAFSNLLFDNISLRVFEERPPKSEMLDALQILSIRDEPVFTVTPIAGHAPLITGKDIERWRKNGQLREYAGKILFEDDECGPGELKTFSMLAREACVPPATPDGVWTSMPCLGVCKADVDNLGMVFSLGLEASFSLASFAMLARMLNYFFAAYLVRVIAKDFPNIYVVFAGGDDVFVIGPWTEAINFGLRMARDFRKFCAENPAITISAGLPLLKPGLPMRAMREEAESLLEKSKNYRNGAKNAVSLFGVSSHWAEAEKLLETGQWLARLCGEEKISRAFLRRLLGYSRECGEFIKGKNLAKNGLYLSHFSYDLARNFRKMKEEGASNAAKANHEPGCAGETCDYARLQKLPNDKDFAKLEMGISWAIYRTRIV